MGNIGCCHEEVPSSSVADDLLEPTAVLDGAITSNLPSVSGGNTAADRIYSVTLSKTGGAKLGLDVDYMAERTVLPIMNITGGAAEKWNNENPGKMMDKGDSIIEVNGASGNVTTMLEKCKHEEVLELKLCRALNYDSLVQDLKNLVIAKECGPILLRLSWHDAVVFNGETGGPNAAMRLPDGEGKFPANAGLAAVGVTMLQAIADKYCPVFISHADLWVLAANVAIKEMGGPELPVRFGRTDAKTAADGASKQDGHLPDGSESADRLREIFKPKGFSDKDIVALYGANTVGWCHIERSGFEGPRTEKPFVFDNSYFKDLMNKQWKDEMNPKGGLQKKCGVNVMFLSDIAIAEDSNFKTYVKTYAEDQKAWFDDFSAVWVKLQELNCSELRDIL